MKENSYEYVLKPSTKMEGRQFLQKVYSINGSFYMCSIDFLKSNNVELRHIFDEFIRCALSNHKVNFILMNEEVEVFNLKESNLKKRITDRNIFFTCFAFTRLNKITNYRH